MNATETLVQFGDVKRPLGELTEAEVESLRHSWHRKNCESLARYDATLEASAAWRAAAAERVPGHSEVFEAMHAEMSANAHRRLLGQTKDVDLLDRRLAELRGDEDEPLFEDDGAGPEGTA